MQRISSPRSHRCCICGRIFTPEATPTPSALALPAWSMRCATRHPATGPGCAAHLPRCARNTTSRSRGSGSHRGAAERVSSRTTEVVSACRQRTHIQPDRKPAARMACATAPTSKSRPWTTAISTMLRWMSIWKRSTPSRRRRASSTPCAQGSHSSPSDSIHTVSAPAGAGGSATGTAQPPAIRPSSSNNRIFMSFGAGRVRRGTSQRS